MLGKHAEAQAQLDRALTDAEPDGFVIPFAENYRYLKPLLAERLQTGTVAQIIELGEAAERRKAGFDRPEALSALTEREYEIVRLMAQRLNNREIAEKLYLSEGSIRQYVNQIYTKLQIAGEPRASAKRKHRILLRTFYFATHLDRKYIQTEQLLSPAAA
ncbi:response regulator transcription factor [Agathobaculum butyriciproducens]|uniref:helix-turn-helix transcriptional regulator n=1 Tax=Agathobaculum butyriciproducens TaxID=1628085 RepID=UPI0036D414B3